MISIINILLILSPYFLYLLLFKNEDENIIDILNEKYTYIGFTIILFFQLVISLLLIGLDRYLEVIKTIISFNPSYLFIEVTSLIVIVLIPIAIILGRIFNYTSIDKHKIGLILLIIVPILVCSIFLINYSYNGNKNISIVEVCRKYIDEYENEDGEEYKEESSYVVIYNNSDNDIYYNNLYLSTDEDNLEEKCVTDIYVQANKNYKIELNYDELDIPRNKNSYLYLSSDKYKDILDIVEIPALEDDIAYVYDKNNDNWAIKQLYPNKINVIDVEEPTFSVKGGFYHEPFDLYINVPEGTTVYYTLDCSDPTENSIKYNNNPIYVYDKSSEENIYRNISHVISDYKSFNIPNKVDKAFVIRAIAVDKNGNTSNILTSSYFINLDKYTNKNVVSLISDPKNLFDDTNGIYVNGTIWDEWYEANYDEINEKIKSKKVDNFGWDNLIGINNIPKKNFLQRGYQWERPANFELYENGSLFLNQSVGIRIQGGSHRVLKMKRFSIYSRKEYSGNRLFNKEIFDDKKTHSLLLREDFDNAFTQILLQDRDISTQTFIPVVVFVDGEFWYEQYMQDKNTESNFAYKYNLAKENIVIAKNQNIVSDNKNPKCNVVDIYNFAKTHDLSNEENYKNLIEIIDVQSYIDYMCGNIYLANMDFTETKNMLMWCTSAKENNNFGDGRWRWGLHDMDLMIEDAVKITNNPVRTYAEINSFNTPGRYVGNIAINEQSLYCALKENETFCKQFVITFMDLINNNFKPETVEEKLKFYGYDMSYMNYFYRDRPIYMKKYLKDEFNLKGNIENVYLSTNNESAGIISINTITPSLKDGWNGSYFSDYPIMLSVDVNKGYKFDHWEVNEKYYSDNLEITIDLLEGGVSIYAVFN